MKLAGRVALGAAATTAEAVVTGALVAEFGPIAAAGAGGAAGAMVKELPTVAEYLFADRRRSAIDMVERAIEIADITSEEFVDALFADLQRRHLLRRAVLAASDSISDEKIRTLAAALAAGAITTDDAVIDESVLVIDAVAQLDAVHLRVLALLATEPVDPAVGTYPNFRPWPWTETQIYDAVPNLASVLPAILAKLQALGIADDFPAQLIDFAEGRLQLTGFGRLCLGYLQAPDEQHRPELHPSR